MKVTVCQLRNDPPDLAHDWDRLVAHVQAEASELVLLPEMPFYPWPAWTRDVDPAIWEASVATHDAWLERLPELGPVTVFGTRPVLQGGHHHNEGYVWEADSGYRAVHTKYYLPDEGGFWEASWYERGDLEFTAVQTSRVKAGMMICTEMWFLEHARAYGKAGIDLLISPRATPLSSASKWVAGGRTAAVVSGAFCLSSNRGGVDETGLAWGGAAWITEPEEGKVLALTTEERPFATVDIDLNVANQAKETYPRYVLE